MGWVCASTNPGSTMRPPASTTSVEGETAPSIAPRLPIAAIRPSRTSMAPSRTMARSRISGPMRARGGPARVTSWLQFQTTNSIGAFVVGRTPSSAPDPLVQLFLRPGRPTRGSAAGRGARPKWPHAVVVLLRSLNIVLGGETDGLFVAGIRVANHAQAGIGGQHALEAPLRFIAAIRHHDHAGVLRVTDAHAAAIVNGNP